MPSFNEETIRNLLRAVQDPELHKDIVTLGMVKKIEIQGNNLSLHVDLTTPACPLKEKIQQDIEGTLRKNLPTLGKIEVHFGAEVKSARPVGQPTNRLSNVRNVIAVGSGKGGVGKSTVAVNLAIALKQEGAKTGLLDADIYGPSIPIMCGVSEGEKPKIAPGNRILPLTRFGMPLMSMGFLMGSQDAVIWRGPMLAKMLQQFLDQVDWGALDYLVVDLPPGTGDVQISLAQMIPLSGAVVVTTPQDVAFADVQRAIKMFQMTHVPLLGIVENMSEFVCPHCAKSSHIFGRVEERYKNLDLPLLGKLPLEIATRESGDRGVPIAEKEPNSPQAKRFRELAKQIAAAQSVQNFQTELELPSLH